MRLIALILLVSGIVTLHAQIPDGFAVFSKGDGAGRTLHLVKLTPGATEAQIAATEQMICAKGTAGGDIQSQISFDGKWLAFSRSRGGNGGGYGGDDYHSFGGWDIYIVSLEGSFPKTPKLVAQGYWPSWSEDSYGATKTLYYSTHSGEKTIRAVTVDASGNLSNDKKIVNVNTGNGFEGFIMCAPNGQFYAGRYGGGVHVYHFAGAMAGQSKGLRDGCHPHITANSKWIVHAKFTAGREDGSKVMRPFPGLQNCGFDCTGSEASYSFGTSQDMKWFISWTSGNWQEQNLGQSVHLFSLTATNTDFSVQKRVKISGRGSWPDVHVWTAPQEVSIQNFSATPPALVATVPEGTGFTMHDINGRQLTREYNGVRVVRLGKQYGAGAYIVRLFDGRRTISRTVIVRN